MLINNSNKDDVKEFEPDDEKYLAWINEHPDGFILTSFKSLYPPHTVIHRASCDKIKTLKGSAKPGGFTERGYIKVYATSVSLLENWVHQKRVDGSSRPCTNCI
jgi:hypothetical protein